MFSFCGIESILPTEPVMADQIVITEKSSQAKDVRAAVGSRYGEILPAEGHLFDLLEPEDVVPEWKRWSPILLRPEGLYGTRPASHSRGTAQRETVLARHGLRSRGSAHRPGNPRALRVPRSGDAGAVHRAGPADHPRRIRSGKTKCRICPALRRRRCAPAGRPNLQSVTDPHRDRHPRTRRAESDRCWPREDADLGHCVQA